MRGPVPVATRGTRAKKRGGGEGGGLWFNLGENKRVEARRGPFLRVSIQAGE